MDRRESVLQRDVSRQAPAACRTKDTATRHLNSILRLHFSSDTPEECQNTATAPRHRAGDDLILRVDRDSQVPGLPLRPLQSWTQIPRFTPKLGEERREALKRGTGTRGIRHLGEILDRLQITNGDRVMEGCERVGGALPLSNHFSNCGETKKYDGQNPASKGRQRKGCWVWRSLQDGAQSPVLAPGDVCFLDQDEPSFLPSPTVSAIFLVFQAVGLEIAEEQGRWPCTEGQLSSPCPDPARISSAHPSISAGRNGSAREERAFRCKCKCESDGLCVSSSNLKKHSPSSLAATIT